MALDDQSIEHFRNMPEDILHFASYWVGIEANKCLNKAFSVDWPHTLVFFPPFNK